MKLSRSAKRIGLTIGLILLCGAFLVPAQAEPLGRACSASTPVTAAGQLAPSCHYTIKCPVKGGTETCEWTLRGEAYSWVGTVAFTVTGPDGSTLTDCTGDARCRAEGATLVLNKGDSADITCKGGGGPAVMEFISCSASSEI